MFQFYDKLLRSILPLPRLSGFQYFRVTTEISHITDIFKTPTALLNLWKNAQSHEQTYTQDCPRGHHRTYYCCTLHNPERHYVHLVYVNSACLGRALHMPWPHGGKPFTHHIPHCDEVSLPYKHHTLMTAPKI